MNRLRSGRSSDSDADMLHTWPALMADMGGTIRGTRCVTRGNAVDNEHPLYANRCELAVELVVTSRAINRDRSVAPRSLAVWTDMIMSLYSERMGSVLLAVCRPSL
jgi:hypothetical protein